MALPFLISDHQRAHRQERFCDVVVYVFKLANYSRRKVAEIVTNEDVLWRARARPGLSRPVQFAPRSNFLAVTAPGRQQYHFCIALFEPRGWVQTASIDIENTTGQVRHRIQSAHAGLFSYELAWSGLRDQVLLWQGFAGPATRRLKLFEPESCNCLESCTVQGLLGRDLSLGTPTVWELVTNFSVDVIMCMQSPWHARMPIDAQLISTAGSSFAEGLAACQTLSRPAFSPDGTFVAYVALLDEGPRKLPVVQFLETKRGFKVHDFQPHVWRGLDVSEMHGHPFSLTWSVSGSHVLLHMLNDYHMYYDASYVLGKIDAYLRGHHREWLTVEKI